MVGHLHYPEVLQAEHSLAVVQVVVQAERMQVVHSLAEPLAEHNPAEVQQPEHPYDDRATSYR